MTYRLKEIFTIRQPYQGKHIIGQSRIKAFQVCLILFQYFLNIKCQQSASLIIESINI